MKKKGVKSMKFEELSVIMILPIKIKYYKQLLHYLTDQSKAAFLLNLLISLTRIFAISSAKWEKYYHILQRKHRTFAHRFWQVKIFLSSSFGFGYGP